MKRFADDRNPESLSADELAVASQLESYAARVAPEASFSFADRVMAATALMPTPTAALGPRAQAARLAGAATGGLRLALGQVSGGSRIPLRVRAQAGAMLLVVALILSAGAVLAAAGAAAVVTWVTAPQASASANGGENSGTPGLGADPEMTDRLQSGDPAGRPTGSPNNCGNGVGNGYGVGNGNGVGNGIGCGNKPSDPGAQASGHPNSSDNPGDVNPPSKDPKATKSPNPTKSPKPTK